MPGVCVDGNDVMAVYKATGEAADRARRGSGPTLIEAVTYRIGPHSSSDDPTRYRTDAEVELWRAKDPLERMRRYLDGIGRWSDDWQRSIEEEAGQQVEDAVVCAEAIEPFTAEEIFEAVFARCPPHLIEQSRMAAEEQ
jgi:pyruvate dehydrogenase E1 component alpha subunit